MHMHMHMYKHGKLKLYKLLKVILGACLRIYMCVQEYEYLYQSDAKGSWLDVAVDLITDFPNKL